MTRQCSETLSELSLFFSFLFFLFFSFLFFLSLFLMSYLSFMAIANHLREVCSVGIRSHCNRPLLEESLVSPRPAFLECNGICFSFLFSSSAATREWVVGKQTPPFSQLHLPARGWGAEDHKKGQLQPGPGLGPPLGASFQGHALLPPLGGRAPDLHYFLASRPRQGPCWFLGPLKQTPPLPLLVNLGSNPSLVTFWPCDSVFLGLIFFISKTRITKMPTAWGRCKD